ncbi:MAG: hypothetical protein GPOALKHO_001578 [Sodalis sp.]|uniref:hypothetical protein n=1 Tax=Sodalis sp. (in: enterobacteria) TaxID=1898979 RepID=UPI0038730382|nr:MAG: hypothetical protein GPOALKHO_001578 [Sodalis sp.]
MRVICRYLAEHTTSLFKKSQDHLSEQKKKVPNKISNEISTMEKELFDQLTKMEQMVAIEKVNWPQPLFTATTHVTLKACGNHAN